VSLAHHPALPRLPSLSLHDALPISIAVLSVIGIIYGGLVAFAQRDAKKLVAYSSVAHLGFVVLGIFAFTAEALQGAMIQMVNHRSEEHTSELQSRENLVCRLLLEKK